jgi:putative transposase
MSRFLQPLLLLLARLTDRELTKVIQFLKEENEILRSRLAKRVALTSNERQRLISSDGHSGRPLRT